MKHPNYRGARTQAEADLILADYPVPDGWRIEAVAVRTFKFRSQWSVGLWHGQVLHEGWRVYDVAGTAYLMQQHANRAERAA